MDQIFDSYNISKREQLLKRKKMILKTVPRKYYNPSFKLREHPNDPGPVVQRWDPDSDPDRIRNTGQEVDN